MPDRRPFNPRRPIHHHTRPITKPKEKENTVLGYGINALKALYPSIEYYLLFSAYCGKMLFV